MKKIKTVVIVPIYETLTDKEELSLDFLRYNLPKHDKYIVCPINFDLSGIDTTGFKIKRLSPGRFKKTGVPLLMSRRFYSYFKEYDYILHHKPGCIVFGNDDDLDKWAEKDFSYVGAPWFKKNKEDRRSLPAGVGKGALSLRKTSDFLKVFDKKDISLTPQNRQSRHFFMEWRYWNRLKRFGAWIHLQQLSKPKSAAHHLMRKFDKEEEIFWAFFAVQISKTFQIPSFDTGYKFALEHTPYKVFDYSLPFGITDLARNGNHKWDKIIEHEIAKRDRPAKVMPIPTKKLSTDEKTIKEKTSAPKKVAAKKPASKKKPVAKKKEVSTTKKRTTKKKSIKKSAA